MYLCFIVFIYACNLFIIFYADAIGLPYKMTPIILELLILYKKSYSNHQVKLFQEGVVKQKEVLDSFSEFHLTICAYRGGPGMAAM